MKVTGLVMAGGKGTRMKLYGEKPMLRIGGVPVVQHVVGALRGANSVERVVVAVSEYTPRTARYLSGFPVEVLVTPKSTFQTWGLQFGSLGWGRFWRLPRICPL